MGPVERAIRTRFTAEETLRTPGQGKPFTIQQKQEATCATFLA